MPIMFNLKGILKKAYFKKLLFRTTFSLANLTSVVDILFPPNHNIHKSSCGLCYWASDLLIERFYKNLSIKGLKPKNKGHTNFYECCDLTKKVYLILVYHIELKLKKMC